MKEQMLKEILEAGDEQACVRFFKGMSEQRRREFAPLCLKWFRKIKGTTFSGNPLMSVAATAAFATATLSELKRLGWRARPNDTLVHELLRDRRPKWIDEWVTTLLDDDQYWARWALIRGLVVAGLANKPDHPNYYLGMINGIAGPRFKDAKPFERCFLEDPKLLEDEVWRLFEYEGGGDNSLANCDRWSGERSWSVALISLMQKGHLPRERLLTCSLDALDRDFNHYRAKWFAKFHDMLEPSLAEQTEFAARYLRLLGVSAPNIVSWAYRKVETLCKGGVYEASALTDGLRPVLESRQKGIVKKALRLLTRTAKECPNSAGNVALVAVTALGHEASDVQEAAFEVIDRFADAEDGEVVSRIADYADLVAPSLRARIGRWTEPTGAANETTHASRETLPDDTSFPIDQLKGLGPELAKLFSIDALIENIEQGRVEVPAASFDGMDIPRLAPDQRLTTIEDLDELIDVCARVIEDASLVHEAERAIDGLSRLCGQKPDDFERRIGPLLKRATQRLKKDMAPFLGIGPDDDICGLVYAWGTGIVLEGKKKRPHGRTMSHFEVEGEEQRWYLENMKKAIGFLSRRSLAVARRVADGRAAPLLSAPTHAGGWIDASDLVQRLNAWSGTAPDITDTCLAMLRLAPDNRSQALRQLKKATTEWGRAIRYALGADRVRMGKTAALWIAAARSRSPWCDDAKLEKAFPKRGPDAGCTASFAFERRTRGSEYYRHTYLTVKSDPRPPKKVDPDFVTVILHAQRGAVKGLTWELGGAGGRTEGSVRWTTTIWPQARESLFAAAACDIADNVDWYEARWQNKTLLEPLLDPGTPLRTMGLLLLSVALAAKEPGENGLATDIAIQAIEDGRLGSDNFGAMLAELLPTGLIKPGRWQKTFSEVARISPPHTLVVQQSLERCLCGAPDKMPRDFAKLLDLLKELSIETGQGITDERCRNFLAGIKGSGKAAKTAKALLALESSEPQLNRQLMLQTLNQRIAAAQRFCQ